MPETPFGPLESLVGRTFEDPAGIVRTVEDIGPDRVFGLECDGHSSLADFGMLVEPFSAWLRGAEEVTQ